MRSLPRKIIPQVVKQANLSDGVLGMFQTIQELNNLKKQIQIDRDNSIKELEKEKGDNVKVIQGVIADADKKYKSIEAQIIQLANSINEKFNNKLQEVSNTLAEVLKIRKGEDGKDADEEKIVQDVLARIPKPKEINEEMLAKTILGKIPKNKPIDENSIAGKILAKVPKPVEIDPMSIIDKIMNLPEGKKLKASNIDGLEQTISSFRSQLAKGYLHGGGISSIVAGSGITAVDDGSGHITVSAPGSTTDEKVKYDVNDPTAGYLGVKIVAGTGISVTEGTGADENKVKISNTQTSAQWGNITGTLSSQTDLQNALNAKINTDQTTPQSLGDTTNRATKLWTTDIESTNAPTVGGVALTALSKDPTGFSVEPTINYDPTTQKITLTGSFVAYYQGINLTVANPTFVSGWASVAHTNTTGHNYFLSYNGSAFVWTTDAFPGFDQVLIASVYYGATNKYALRECHGFMPWQTHKTIHETIGTYKYSGGTIPAASYALSSTTAADRRPNIDETTIQDEDLATVLPALTSETYTQYYLGNSSVGTYALAAADILPLSTNNPYYNTFSTPNWGQTLMPANSVATVWIFALPVTSSANSQAYRYLFVQPQWITQATGPGAAAITTAINTEALRLSSELNLGTLTVETPELVCIGKIVLAYVSSNWTLRQVTLLTGNKYSQIGSPSGNYLSIVATDATLTGDGTGASPLGIVKPPTKRSDVQASTASITPETSTYDVFVRTAQAEAIVINNHSTTTPTESDGMLIRLTCDATARAVTYGTNYVTKSVPLPSILIASKMTSLYFMWSSTLSKWILLSCAQE